MRTEAYTWPITAFVGGIAVGAALAGALVEGPGWRFAFVVAAAFAGFGALLAVARRATVVPPAAA
jgi:predicted MFS family arabinose efflux permease